MFYFLVHLCFSAMGVGNAELLSSMMVDEKAKAEVYLKTLTDKMKNNHVGNTAEIYTE